MRGLKLVKSGGGFTRSGSHPSWVRGLKLSYYIRVWKVNYVAPLVGAWIETSVSSANEKNAKSRTPRGCVD